jgi:hypothetical protein
MVSDCCRTMKKHKTMTKAQQIVNLKSCTAAYTVAWSYACYRYQTVSTFDL